MNYRHAFHAGNFADVVKHLALTAILLHLKKKDAPFAVVDTHAGRGIYDLTAAESRRTEEADGGIARILAVETEIPSLKVYLEQVRALGRGQYPGSPLLAARLIRPQDRLIALERHPEEHEILAKTLSPWRKATAELADGYARLPKLLPPPERRGLILIDPPYEQPDEFAQAAAAVASAYRRFATGIFLIWFPIKSSAEAGRFCGEIIGQGVGKVLRIDIEVAAAGEGRMNKAGLVILNPPFGFEAEMAASLRQIAPALGTDGGAARWEIQWLSGSGHS